ncbi:MAG: PfkB family carbohydrate kinase [archaeon]
MAKANVIIAGSIGLDSVKTPFGSVENEIGGSATFSSIACAIFAKPAVLSIVGKDFPKEKLKVLEKKGIDLSALQYSDKPNMRWKAHYDFDINTAHTDSFEANAFADLLPILPENLLSAEFISLGNWFPDKQLQLLKSFKKKPMLSVTDSIEYYITNFPKQVLDVVNATDIALFNDGEARQLFKTTNLMVAAKEILKLNSDYAIIKKGEHGCVMFSKNGNFSCPGFPLENVVDPTGCGDSFAGALLGYLSKTKDFSEKNMRKAIVVSSAVASFNAESHSFYRLAEVTKKEVKERVKAIKEISKF